MVVVHIDRGGETLNLRSAVRIGRRGALLATLVAAWVVAAFAQARLDPRLLAA